MKRIRSGIFLTIIMLWVSQANALEPIPKESGFGGFLSPGLMATYVESNMMAGNQLFDMGDHTIHSLGSPGSETIFSTALNFELKYTFADTRTQIVFGNSLEDLLTYDLVTLLGVRQDLKEAGIMAGSFVFNGIPTKVWEDPYLFNIKRGSTDRTSTGIRFTWDKIFSTGFQVQSTYRKIVIDKERSGFFLGLTPYQKAQLDREGDYIRSEISYRFRIQKGQFLVPAVVFTRDGLDGDAMSSDAFDLQLSYLLTRERYNFLFNGLLGFADFDKRNPIFNKTRKDDRYGLGMTVFYPMPDYLPLGCTSFHLWCNAAYYKSDANISFYDTVVANLAMGIILYY